MLCILVIECIANECIANVMYFSNRVYSKCVCN